MSDTNPVEPNFEVRELHKKALTVLLHSHHNNGESLTYPELSLRVGSGEKTKAWQCGAWRDLKQNGYIVSSSSTPKSFVLSETGMQLARQYATDEKLAEFRVPDTNAALHDKIKSKLARISKADKYGPKILDFMLQPDYEPMTRHELAKNFGTLADSHGFFYGLKALKNTLGYVVECSPDEIAKWKAKQTTTNTEDANSKKRKAADSDESVIESEEHSQNDKKQKTGDSKESDHEDKEAANGKKKKKKVYNSKKKRSGGKPLKLADKAYIIKPGSVKETFVKQE